jgi:transketolase
MPVRVMRDVLIERIHETMREDEKVVFLSGDFGAPTLDALRANFPERFYNVGIAEQNLINVAAGFGLEGYTVFAYGISAFIIMRAYEQIRTNLSLMSQIRPMNVTLIGVGSGLSYNVSGPTHHSLEDLSLVRFLPNFEVFTPADHVVLEKFSEKMLWERRPKYIRLEGKPVESIYDTVENLDMDPGFCELRRGEKACVVSCGHMTHRALEICDRLRDEGESVGLVDVFLPKSFDREAMRTVLGRYSRVVSVEEGFLDGGGLDSLVANVMVDRKKHVRIGIDGHHIFELGAREELHDLYGLGEKGLRAALLSDA